MALYTENSLNGVITNAINSLDAIYSAIKLKLGSVAPSDWDGTPVGVAVSEYAGMITNRLWSVENVTSSTWNSGNGTIKNYTGTNVSLDSNSVSYESGSMTISGVLHPGLGVYSNVNNVIAQFSTSQLTISGNTLSTNGWTTSDDQPWTYAVPNNTVISTVSLTKAAIEIASGTISNNSVNNAVTISATTGEYQATLTAPDQAQLSNYISIPLSAVSNLTGNLEVTAQPTLTTPGYIHQINGIVNTTTATRALGSGSGQLNLNSSGSSNLYIRKGQLVLGDAAGGEVTFSDESSLLVEEADKVSGKSYYDISATAGAVSYPQAQISEGYISGQSVTIEKGASSETRYILHGAVQNNTVSRNIEVKTNDSNLVLDAGAGVTGYTVVLGQDGANLQTGVIDPGYIKESSYTTAVNIPNLSLKIPKAAITNAAVGDTITVSRLGGEVALDSEGYSLNLGVSGSISSTITQDGYYLSTTSSTNTPMSNLPATNTLYVKKGSITATSELTVTPHFNDEDTDSTDGPGATGSPIEDILLSTLPNALANSDYYQLTLGIARSVTDGYIKGSTDATWTTGQNFYLPKAQIQWIDAGGDGEDYLQVTQAGYLPSGDITNISTATIQESTLNATLATSGTNIITTSAGANGAYALSIGKGTVDAGYMSKTKGTLQLANTYYINKAQITATVTTAAPTFDATQIAWNATSQKYELPISSSASLDKTVTIPGYATASEIALNTTNANNSATLQLPQAETSIELPNLTSALDKAMFSDTGAVTFVPSTTSTAFPISIDLSRLDAESISRTVGAKITTAGYGASNSGASSLQLTGTGTIYLQPGSVELDNSANGTYAQLAYSNNFSTASTGDYTITVTAPVARILGTFHEGYIANNSEGINSNHINLTNNTVTVARGSISSQPQATASVSASCGSPSRTVRIGELSELFQNTNTLTNGVDYIVLTATPSASVVNVVNTDGYIKSGGGDISTLSAINTASSLYMERYNTTEEEDNDITVYSPSGSGIYQDTVYTTGGKYLEYNTKIKLHADAMGANVANDLTRLQQRLAGQEYSSLNRSRSRR